MTALLSPEEQWDRTVALYLRTEREPLGSHRTLGIVVRQHKLFAVGDVVVAARGDADRCPVWAESSKGYFVRYYRMRYIGRRRRIPAGPLRLVELPSSLLGRSLADNFVRDYVLRSLRERPHA